MRWTLLAAGLLVPSFASAHIALTYPPPRTTMQKARHCGQTGLPRGTNVTTLAPGATITVTWKETVDHPGHYRISFDNDGENFFIPPNATATTVGMDPTVMIDLIADVQGGTLPAGGRMYSQQITLPNIECTTCTLQVIQLMTDKSPYTTTATSDDIYFQCADITLSNTTPPPGPDAGVGGDDAGTTPPPGDEGGCSTGGHGAALPVGLAFLALVGRRRRR